MRVDPGASSRTRSWPEHGSESHSHEDCIRKTTPAGVIGTMCSGTTAIALSQGLPCRLPRYYQFGHRSSHSKRQSQGGQTGHLLRPSRLYRRLSAVGNSRCRSGCTSTVSLPFPCPRLTETGDKISQRTKITISSRYRSKQTQRWNTIWDHQVDTRPEAGDGERQVST